MADTYDIKIRALRRRFHDLGSAVVAFSGGVDSSVLSVVAHEVLGDRMVAAIAISPSLPARDRVQAESLCRLRGIPLHFVSTCEFDDDTFIKNPNDRCYYCKSYLYKAFSGLADELGFRYIVEGTNASDLDGHRPGHKASRENSRVATPLIDTGFNKDEVRRLAKELGLPTADKPSSACLSSRVPTGTILTPELMSRIDAAEEILRSVGARQVRVRHHGEVARIEVEACDMLHVIKCKDEVVAGLGSLGWKFVSLDLSGYRTGGMHG